MRNTDWPGSLDETLVGRLEVPFESLSFAYSGTFDEPVRGLRDFPVLAGEGDGCYRRPTKTLDHLSEAPVKPRILGVTSKTFDIDPLTDRISGASLPLRLLYLGASTVRVGRYGKRLISRTRRARVRGLLGRVPSGLSPVQSKPARGGRIKTSHPSRAFGLLRLFLLGNLPAL